MTTEKRLTAVLDELLVTSGKDIAKAARLLWRALNNDTELRDLAMVQIVRTHRELSAGGQIWSASFGHGSRAADRHPFGGGHDRADIVQRKFAPASFSGEGHPQDDATQGVQTHPALTPPSAHESALPAVPKGQSRTAVREPSSSDREARKRVAIQSAKLGWIGVAIVPNGPSYQNLKHGDLRGMEERMFREGGERIIHGVAMRALRATCEKRQLPDSANVLRSLPASTIRDISEATKPDALKAQAREYIEKFAPAKLAGARA